MLKILKLTACSIVLLFMAACANSGQVQHTDGKVLNSGIEFSYKNAFVSKNQPDPSSFLVDEEYIQEHIKKILVEKGYFVGGDVIELSSYKAKEKGQSIFVECAYSGSQRFTYKNGALIHNISCGGFDLYDGEKVYSGEAEQLRLAFSDEFLMTMGGVRLSLLKLPNVSGSSGSVMSAADEFTLVEKR